MEKIDIKNKDILVYDESNKLIKILNLDDIKNYQESYLADCTLFTLNLTIPDKRIVKFNGEDYSITLILKYEDMDDKQKFDFDDFVSQVEQLLIN